MKLALPRRSLLPLLLLAVLPGSVEAQREPAVVLLVRHAEKSTTPAQDPALTPEGVERARLLATLLGDIGLDRVLSTDTDRTLGTARPTAERAGVAVELYDPRRLEALAAALRAEGGRVLVVGHSNTTPALVSLLGGDEGGPIDEPAEYDRLYLLTIPQGGPTTTVLLRFGRPFRP